MGRIEKIYCLSLEGEEKRKKIFKEGFSVIETPIEFVHGIDGRIEIPRAPDWLSEYTSHNRYKTDLRKEVPVLNYSMSATEKACAIGHLNIWKKIADLESDDYFLVCEDDTCMKNPEAFQRELAVILSQIGQGELIYLGYRDNLSDPRGFWFFRMIWHFFKQFSIFHSVEKMFRFKRSVFVAPTKNPFRKGIKVAGQHWGAFGYLIDKYSAVELIRLNASLEMTSDGTMRYAQLSNTIPTYAAFPGLLVVMEELGSSIRSSEEHRSNFQTLKFG